MKEIYNSLKQLPKAYEASKIPVWDDTYISKQMLKAHLDDGQEGASRNKAFIDASVQWMIGNLANKKGRALDMGCGPGLYSERFARLGYTVQGIDISKRSLAYARKQAQKQGLRIQYQRMDYRFFKVTDMFDLIIMIYCDYGVLNFQERKCLLQDVMVHLKDGGMFVFDVFSKCHYHAFKNSDTIRYEETGFWSEDPYVCIKRDRGYPRAVYLEQYTIINDEKMKVYNLWNTAFDIAGIQKELHAVGFKDICYYGDCKGSDYKVDSPTICVIARK